MRREFISKEKKVYFDGKKWSSLNDSVVGWIRGNTKKQDKKYIYDDGFRRLAIEIHAYKVEREKQKIQPIKREGYFNFLYTMIIETNSVKLPYELEEKLCDERYIEVIDGYRTERAA